MNLTKDELNHLFFQALDEEADGGVSCTLVNGADINARNEYGQTALTQMTKDGNTEMVYFLLTHSGIDVMETNAYGETALTIAQKRLGVIKNNLKQAEERLETILDQFNATESDLLAAERISEIRTRDNLKQDIESFEYITNALICAKFGKPIRSPNDNSAQPQTPSNTNHKKVHHG